MKHQINASLQIIPLNHPSDKTPYGIVDAAIGVIQDSGLRYDVSPMETVVEGSYDQIMAVFQDAQQASIDAGAGELIVFIRLHIRAGEDIRFEEKTSKY